MYQSNFEDRKVGESTHLTRDLANRDNEEKGRQNSNKDFDEEEPKHCQV